MLPLYSRYLKFSAGVLLCAIITLVQAQTDPGVRTGIAGAGGPLPGLSASELARFNEFKDAFQESENVPDGLAPASI